MSMTNKLSGFVVFIMLVLISGCAAAPQTSKLRYVWPLPPAEPRIEFLAAYSGSSDMQKTSVLSQIVGEDEGTWLYNPMMAVGDLKSRMYVTDKERLSVYLFDFNVGKITKIGGVSLEGLLKHTNGLALDAQGLVYISDTLAAKIYVIDPADYQRIARVIDLSAHLKSIARFAIDKRAGRLVIPDFAGNKIVVTDLQGKHLFSFGTKGTGDGEFNSPQAVAIDNQSNIVVCDVFNARIQRFTGDGKFINAFGKRGDKGGDFSIAKGVAVDSEGHIYVTDGKEHHVTIFSDKGDYLLTFGFPYAQQPGALVVAGGFLLPQGISIDENDRIYVADQQNGRVQLFQYLNARYIKENPILPNQLPKLQPTAPGSAK